MNRIKLFLSAVCICISSIFAQQTNKSIDVSDPVSIKFDLSPVSSLPVLLPVMNHEKEEHCLNIRGIVSGILLVAAGTVLSVNGYYCGEEHYRSYKYSAFTENTDKKRRKVVMSNLKCVGGAAIAGTGLLVTILSF